MRVNSPRLLPLIPPLWASQRALSQANLHYDPIVHYSILYYRSLPYWSTFSAIACWKVGHCRRVDLTLGFIFVSLGLFWRVSIVWLSEGEGEGEGRGRGIADFGICYLRLVATLGMRSFGISSEVYRIDVVWKKLITQGPRGVLSIWLIGNISRYDSKNKMHFSPKVNLEVFLCLNVMVTWYVTRPKKLNVREIG